ncbi:protein kinase [Lentzea sp. NBC_00516]|uniref:serine/threonine-protein kinase n=1 Tax=Lentzea sp. NBC_00516 TaxID=2903582 RepID=UPI002E822028|nr:protein kinase [Lentzea sp. NBC_00516]WUD26822.1 protein kinase [Lentzea sp. NBC_00516]
MTEETFGPYRIEQLLGRGGMGEVHRAYDTAHDRFVALKRLSPGYHDDEDYRARFRREARIVARLREPHVIPIHAYGEIDDRLYLDMRLVEGSDLSDLIREQTLDPVRAVRIVDQVASALDAAHADGLVHRDVKPSNILVTSSDFVYLVDFGIARSVSPSATGLTASGSVVGTLDYMAPERFESGLVDGRADIYALACVLFACLAGRRPFTADGTAAQIWAHLNEAPPKASPLNPAVPAALDDVIAKGMAKNPADRYATAGAFAQAAAQALTAPATPPAGLATPGILLGGQPGFATPGTPSAGHPGPAASGTPPVGQAGFAAPGTPPGGQPGLGNPGTPPAGQFAANTGTPPGGQPGLGNPGTPPAGQSALANPGTPPAGHPGLPRPVATGPQPPFPRPAAPGPQSGPLTPPPFQHTATGPQPVAAQPYPPTRARTGAVSPAKRAALAVGALAVVVGIVVTSLIVANKDKILGTGTTSSSTPSSTQSSTPTTTTTTPTKTRTPQDNALLDALPAIYRTVTTTCAPTAPDTGTVATVRCGGVKSDDPYAPPPAEAEFRLFADRAKQDGFFQAVVTSRGIPRMDERGGCRPKSDPIHYALFYRDTSGPLEGEFTTCFLADGNAQVWWVDTRNLTIGTLKKPGDVDTLDKLDLWWNHNVLSQF